MQLRNAEQVPQDQSIVKPIAIACESRAGRSITQCLPLLVDMFLLSCRSFENLGACILGIYNASHLSTHYLHLERQCQLWFCRELQGEYARTVCEAAPGRHCGPAGFGCPPARQVARHWEGCRAAMGSPRLVSKYPKILFSP